MKELVAAAQDGDGRAYGDLVDRFAPAVTGIAYSILGDFAASEDVGQEVFLEAWGKLSSLRDGDRFAGWICTLAKRRAIDAARRRPPRATADIAETASTAPSPATVFHDSQQREMVWEVLEGLPEIYRETMVLYYRCEQSTEQVAASLDTSSATIRQRLKRGRELLRDEVMHRLTTELRTSAPAPAFSATVLAALPAISTGSTGAGLASAATLQANASAATTATSTGTAAATGMSMFAVIMGPLLGLAGGFLGAWASWRNADYQSQRELILRSSKLYIAVLVAWGISLGTTILLASKLSSGLLAILLIIEIVGFQVWNACWIYSVLSGFKKVTLAAEESQEPLLPGAPKRRTAGQTMDGREDRFQWSLGGWFGAVFGGCAWMLLAAAVVFARGDSLAATDMPAGRIASQFTAPGILLGCFAYIAIMGTLFWQRRDVLPPFAALRLLLLHAMAATIVCFLVFEFLCSEIQQAALSWTPWAWLALLIFPIIALQQYWNRSHQDDGSA